MTQLELTSELGWHHSQRYGEKSDFELLTDHAIGFYEQGKESFGFMFLVFAGRLALKYNGDNPHASQTIQEGQRKS